MEKDTDKKQRDPNFDSLDDRLIASRPSSPSLVIKTNLDQQNTEELNPYYQKENQKDPEKFQNFFKE
ncbi:hypothetical protein FZC78_06840 [Rossellomorea vietnamensis]|uniref:Uncharacterized protein n=1 Tax=Rossellomorea vietnamensis TaxID=218284 RepID=A0A5D4NUH1_9BACI|nr:hypothetical protein [Rossellomorea vietnamensis]TYS17580.1 hypothetical protein FZC78_06840 [Rossellomorea vietnamensis]